MKIGDLVKWKEMYWNPDLAPSLVGVVLEHDSDEKSLVSWRVRWTNHRNGIERDWYRKDELIVMVLK